MLSKAEMAVLLGRPLTTAEDTNFDLYLDIATEQLEDLLCMQVSKQSGTPTATARTFESRDGYRTLYVDPYTEITSVEVDGNATTDYTEKQNDRFDGSWFNIVEFERKQTYDTVVVTAKWGFASVPADLRVLLSKLFAQVSVQQTIDNNVKSKKIEDFTVTYKDATDYDDFILSNSKVIDKYSQCNQGIIRHGWVRPYWSTDESVRPLYQ